MFFRFLFPETCFLDFLVSYSVIILITSINFNKFSYQVKIPFSLTEENPRYWPEPLFKIRLRTLNKHPHLRSKHQLLNPLDSTSLLQKVYQVQPEIDNLFHIYTNMYLFKIYVFIITRSRANTFR